MVYERVTFLQIFRHGYFFKSAENRCKIKQNEQCKFVYYMRKLTFAVDVRHGYFLKNTEKRWKIKQSRRCKFVKYMRRWIFCNPWRYKNLHAVKKNIVWKPCKYNKNRTWRNVRYMRGQTFSVYKITRYICIIVAINAVNTTKIRGDLACGIWEKKLL